MSEKSYKTMRTGWKHSHNNPLSPIVTRIALHAQKRLSNHHAGHIIATQFLTLCKRFYCMLFKTSPFSFNVIGGGIGVIFSVLCFCQPIQAQNLNDSIRVHYRQGYSTLEMSLGNNQAALKRFTDSLTLIVNNPLYRLKSVSVIGGASPEGNYKLNQRLSEKRAKKLFDYLAQQGQLTPMATNFVYLGVDWHGLLELVQKDTDVPYRDEVIALIEDILLKSADKASLASQNLHRLANLRGGQPYHYMYRVLFPELRGSTLTLSYEPFWQPATFAPFEQLDVDTSGVKVTLPDVASLPQPFANMATRHPFCMGLKTNLLYDALLVPNIGVEFYLGRNFSISTDWHYAWWNTKSWFWRTYGGELSIRKWLGQAAKANPLTGHHVGIYGQALTYDFLAFGTKGYMSGNPGEDLFDRASWAVGIEYGYSLPITKQLNLDFVIGIGYQTGKYNEYELQDDCYVWKTMKNRRFIGPTKAEVTLVWLLGKGKNN